MIFYYYLSDKTEKYMVNLLKDDGISYEEAWLILSTRKLL